MLIAHNKSFDYWLATDLLYSIKISESKQSKILQDNAVFKPYGIYTVSTNGKTHIVAK